MRANKACEIKYEGPEFDKISAPAKDLLKKMLDPSPETRLSALQALEHPFLVSKESGGLKLNLEGLNTYDVDYLANVRQK